MTRHDATLPIRLVTLLESGIRPEDRTVRRIAELLCVSRGCVEYHVRNLRRAGQLFTDEYGRVAARATWRQLPFQLEFDLANVVEMSAARRRRIELAGEAKSYCPILIVTELPASLTAEEIAEVLSDRLGARDVKVFGELCQRTGVRETSGS